MEFINRYLLGTAIPVLLVLSGLCYMIWLKGFPFIHPIQGIRQLFDTKTRSDGISPFRALTLALAGTLGVGNLVGVASAIYCGGFGAVFWMWISALAAMVLKYAEIVLALLHRKQDKDGAYHGGAMYYIRAAFEGRYAALGRVLAVLFALLCLLNALSMGCVVQINAVAGALEGVMGFPPALCGGLLALVTVVVTKRGTRGIARLTEALVPLMTLCFIVMSLAILIIKRDCLPAALTAIVSDALSPAGAAGGIGGFFLSRAVRYGTIRGLISNEAGCGTAPIAHATADVRQPTTQGLMGIVEVFVDTILLCTMTALVVIVSYDTVAPYGENAIMMTVKAFSTVLGPWSEYVMCASVLLFGLATILCWAHYGLESLSYVAGAGRGVNLFIWVYGVFVFWGALAAPGGVWQMADLSIGCMTLINLAVLLKLHRQVTSLDPYEKSAREYSRAPLAHKFIRSKGGSSR